MSTRGKILLTIFGLMCIGLVIWVVRTTPDKPPVFEKIEPPKTMEYENNTLSEEVNGVKIWDLTAKRMIIDIETQNVEMTDIIGHFYQEDGRSIEIKAKNGTYENNNKNIHVEGDVEVTTSENAKLTSVKLDWINKDGILIANEKVKMTKDDIIATGDRAESKDGFNHFWIKGHAHIVKGAKEQ